jgi:hypothetical protein
MDCKTCRSSFPDLAFEPEHTLTPVIRTHIAGCEPCRVELAELRGTFALLDEWAAPEPSAYFDARVRAHLRDAEAARPEGLWERLVNTLRFSTGRGFRSAVAFAFVLALLLSGGTVATIWTHQGTTPAASPTVNDLKIYDNNAQALQQMDILDDSGSDASTAQPQS